MERIQTESVHPLVTTYSPNVQALDGILQQPLTPAQKSCLAASFHRRLRFALPHACYAIDTGRLQSATDLFHVAMPLHRYLDILGMRALKPDLSEPFFKFWSEDIACRSDVCSFGLVNLGSICCTSRLLNPLFPCPQEVPAWLAAQMCAHAHAARLDHEGCPAALKQTNPSQMTPQESPNSVGESPLQNDPSLKWAEDSLSMFQIQFSRRFTARAISPTQSPQRVDFDAKKSHRVTARAIRLTQMSLQRLHQSAVFGIRAAPQRDPTLEGRKTNFSNLRSREARPRPRPTTLCEPAQSTCVSICFTAAIAPSNMQTKSSTLIQHEPFTLIVRPP